MIGKLALRRCPGPITTLAVRDCGLGAIVAAPLVLEMLNDADSDLYYPVSRAVEGLEAGDLEPLRSLLVDYNWRGRLALVGQEILPPLIAAGTTVETGVSESEVKRAVEVAKSLYRPAVRLVKSVGESAKSAKPILKESIDWLI